MLKTVLVLVTFLGATAAHADIFDRINDCEDAGGGSCVFDLLRELAAGQSSSSTSWFVGLPNQSCSDLCQSHGLGYDAKTASADNDGTCGAVAQSLGFTGTVGGTTSCTGEYAGTGCAYWPSGADPLFWCGPATPTAKSPSLQRFCSCK